MLKQTNKLIKFTRLKKNYYNINNNDKNFKSIFKTFINDLNEHTNNKINLNSYNDNIIYKKINCVYNFIKTQHKNIVGLAENDPECKLITYMFIITSFPYAYFHTKIFGKSCFSAFLLVLMSICNLAYIIFAFMDNFDNKTLRNFPYEYLIGTISLFYGCYFLLKEISQRI